MAPILEALKINCRKIEQKEFQSIDEQIVPAKTKFSGIRKYNPKGLTVKRFDHKRKMHVQVECPNVVKRYNKSMGGVDLADMLIALYRTRIKTKRWYLSLIFHAVDIAKVNAWLLYCRYANQLKISKAKQLPLLGFISEISQSLIKAEKASPAPRSAGRPPKRSMIFEEETTPKRGRVPKVALPDIDSRFYQYAHWPEHREKKNKCRHCKKGYSRVYCQKCALCLCFNGQNNCFTQFHIK